MAAQLLSMWDHFGPDVECFKSDFPEGFIRSTLIDVAEEYGMAEAQEIFQYAIEQGHLGLAALDVDGRYLAANAAFVALHGLKEGALPGRHWESMVNPGDRPRAREAFRMARTAGHGYVEVRAWRPDAVVVYQALTVTGVTDSRGEFAGYRCLQQDITGYRRDHGALTLAAEAAPNGLLILTADGAIQSANPAIEKLFGYSREELTGKPVTVLFPACHDGTEFTARLSGKYVPGRKNGGQSVPLQVYLNRMSTATGEVYLCSILDMEQEMAVASAAKSDFLTRMSHEIRTPMNLIMGMNALLMNSVLTDKQRQHVEISYRNGRRLLRVINGMLDQSKAEAGKLTLNAAAFDLGELLQECAATMAAALEQKGLLIETSIDPGTWRYWVGDGERLQQVLLTLIGNAIQFTARGCIQVAVSTQLGSTGAQGLRFEVTDTGSGVPPDRAQLIFEDSQYADVRSYEGKGIGLPNAKRLVEMMSGRIWLEHPPHPGARFVFSVFFPKTSGGAVSDRLRLAGPAGVVSQVEAGTRVLVAEDNPENVILLRAYLENVPLALQFARNGAEALEKRRQSNFDLILMDIQMPVMDGHTATREIRTWEAANHAPRVPIVALTAHALSTAPAASLEAGADGHFTKPVDRNELVEAIAKWARRPAKVRSEAIPASIAALRPAFLSNRWQDLERLKAALPARDFATIRTIGHNCKGTGIGYGFPEISRLGGAIERAAQTADIEAAQAGICDFEFSLVEARREQRAG